MNNKGFTLIELIIAIAILAMLALLSTPNIIKMIEKNKVDNYNATIDSIIEATEIYVSNNRYDLEFDEDEVCTPTDSSSKSIKTTIKLKDLIERKDISSPVKNHCTDEEIDNETTINISLNCGTRQFSYEIPSLEKLNDGQTCDDL